MGKQCLKQQPGGCMLAQSDFAESKKGLFQSVEEDVMKEQVGAVALEEA